MVVHERNLDFAKARAETLLFLVCFPYMRLKIASAYLRNKLRRINKIFTFIGGIARSKRGPHTFCDDTFDEHAQFVNDALVGLGIYDLRYLFGKGTICT